MKRLIALTAPALIILCLASVAGAQDNGEAGIVSPQDPVGMAIERILSGSGSISGSRITNRVALKRFYEGRGFELAFSGSRAARKDSKALIEEMEAADAHGLNTDDYHLVAITGFKERIDEASEGERDRLLAQRDILMSDAFLTLAEHLECGINNPYFSTRDNQRPPKCEFDSVAVLEGAIANHDVKETLEGLPPQTDKYKNLQKALVKMRKVEADWPTVGAVKKKIEPGDSHPRIIEVRRRLEATGFIEPQTQSKVKTRAEINEEMLSTPAEPGEDFYDDKLVEAVKQFQAKYGLKEDGVIGKRTVLMMNRRPDWRVCQIRVNLDRFRVLDHVIVTDRYALVNIPGFSLTIFEENKPIKKMKVIVGRLDRKSPLMSDNIRLLVFSPKWHVPTSIAVKDKLPKIKKDPSFIRRHGMTLYAVGDTGIERIDAETVDWESVDENNFSYRIVQASGDANALGRVKFLFPNRHAVYLHDTPTKYLFKRGKRTYSSGCIRISDPIWFAEYLLSDKDGWDDEKIKNSMRRATPLHVNLDEQMPVHILYLTAWADEDGNPSFRHDVYGFDRVVSKSFCD